jgi:hypothetical protein
VAVGRVVLLIIYSTVYSIQYLQYIHTVDLKKSKPCIGSGMASKCDQQSMKITYGETVLHIFQLMFAYMSQRCANFVQQSLPFPNQLDRPPEDYDKHTYMSIVFRHVL